MLLNMLCCLGLASFSLALPAAVQLKDVTRASNDTTKITNLDISETTATTMKLQLIDLSDVKADLSRQIEQQDALAGDTAQSLLDTLKLSEDGLKVLNVELTTTSTRDIDFDQIEAQDQDYERVIDLKQTGKKGGPRKSLEFKQVLESRSSKQGGGEIVFGSRLYGASFELDMFASL